MTALDPNRPEELKAFEARYWFELQMTLRRVFHADPELVEHYRRSMMEAPPFQRALALHDHPLDVASTLTGISLTADHIALYDDATSPEAEAVRTLLEPRTKSIADLADILSSARRDENAPMVTTMTLNKFMAELGYQRLTIRSGVAYFPLSRKALKRPLPRQFDMETLPGVTADGIEVYGLDRVLNMLNGIQEFARRKRPDSSIVARIEKIKIRLVRAATE
jgi:hypothetical protein